MPTITTVRMKPRSVLRRAISGGSTAHPMTPATIIPTSSPPEAASETPEG